MVANKRGNMMIILILIGGMMMLVMGGVMLAIGSSTINWVMDETVPELQGLGMVGDVNATYVTDLTVGPANAFIQNFTWVAGLIYIFGIIGIFGLAFAARNTGDKWLIGFYVVSVLLLILVCIFMSNIYQDIHDGNGAFALIMQEHVMLSYLVLYSPGFMAIIAFIAGVILFSGPSQGGAGY